MWATQKVLSSYVKTHPRNAVYVRYEDLVQDSNKFIEMLLRKFDIPCSSDAAKVTCHVKFGKCTTKAHFNESSYEWTPDNWNTVLNNVNATFEQELGYDLIH